MHQKHRNINKYLKLEAEGLEGFFTGQILCIVALICWYLMVAKEAVSSLFLGVHFFLFLCLSFFFLYRFSFCIINYDKLQIPDSSVNHLRCGFETVSRVAR